MTGAIVADKRGGDFADDLYLVMSDNRNGTRDSTNSDVFLFKSLDGGSSWIGPTRVNDDSSTAPANRDCGRAGQPACPAGVNTGNDQFWPWVDINDNGDLNIAFKDRRLDVDSMAHEWPTSRARPGNYLVWTWGAQCEVKRSTASECLAPTAAVIPQPTGLVNPSGPFPGAGPSSVGPLRQLRHVRRAVELRLLVPGGDLRRRLRVGGGDQEPRPHADDRRAERPLVGRTGRRSDVPVAAGPQSCV